MLPVWNLDHLLLEKDIPSIISEVQTRVQKLVRQRKHFNPDVSEKRFFQIMRDLEILQNGVSKLASYVSNRFSQNMKDQKAQALKNTLRGLGAEIDTQLLFISQEWKRFDTKNANRLIKACPQYAYHLKKSRKGRKHMLNDDEERIITVKDINGSGALNSIYSMLASGFTYMLDGEELTQGEVLKLIRSPKAEMRRKAYDVLLEKYIENKDTLGTIYQHIIDDWRREAELRKYKAPISVRNRANDLPDKAVTTLLKVCKKNAQLFQEYHKKKAKLLKMKKLSRYDLYAPLSISEETITYDEALKQILAAFEKFHPKFHGNAKKIIDSQHIHARVQKNKRTGAYCNSPAPDVTPYILLSFTNDVETMRTLAHELGHGIHGVLANKQNIYHYDAPLPICETASIFSELLLNEQLKEQRPQLAKEILIAELDDFYATIMRQAWFVIFEQSAHELVAQHPSVDEMSQMYMTQLKEQFGEMEIPEQFAYEWLYIPHIFHTPFYCYAYSFGCLLSVAFYAQYKKDPAFADKIVKFLEKGGSNSPEKMVKATGFDVADEKFWQAGFDVIKKMIDEL